MVTRTIVLEEDERYRNEHIWMQDNTINVY